MDFTPAPPRFPDADARDRVRGLLAAASFREAPLCTGLGVERWTDLGRLRQGERLQRVRALEAPAAVALELFWLGSALETARAEDALGRAGVRALEASGFVRREDRHLHPLVTLSPVGDLAFASDPPQRHRSRAADFVPVPGGATRILVDFMLRGRCEAALDLGCGGGALGAVAAGHARRVVATDVNSRALAFARFNLELNRLDGVECREGSLFEPVRSDRFDLVVCNPPFVLSPAHTFVFRDGGPEITRRIVAEAARHLTPGGTLQMLLEWPEAEGEDWRREVAGWVEGSGCDAWLLRFNTEAPEAYAERWLLQEHEGGEIPDAALGAWVAHLEDQGIASVGGGLLVLRPATGAAGRACLRDAPKVERTALAASLSRWLGGQALIAALVEDHALLDTVLAPPPELERRDVRSTAGEGWALESRELRLRTGLCFAARVDPVAAEVVGLLDGRRTPRAALDLLCASLALPPAPFLEGLPGALRRLVELGLLAPPE